MNSKKSLILALLFMPFKTQGLPLGFNARGSVYIPIDDDALEFVVGIQAGNATSFSDFTLSSCLGIRFYDEDLSAVGVLSVPLLGNKLQMNGKDYLRRISLSGHVVWELTNVPNLMVGPYFSFSPSGIQFGITISKKMQRYELGASVFGIKQLKFLAPEKPAASAPTPSSLRNGDTTINNNYNLTALKSPRLKPKESTTGMHENLMSESFFDNESCGTGRSYASSRKNTKQHNKKMNNLFRISRKNIVKPGVYDNFHDFCSASQESFENELDRLDQLGKDYLKFYKNLSPEDLERLKFRMVSVAFLEFFDFNNLFKSEEEQKEIYKNNLIEYWKNLSLKQTPQNTPLHESDDSLQEPKTFSSQQLKDIEAIVATAIEFAVFEADLFESLADPKFIDKVDQELAQDMFFQDEKAYPLVRKSIITKVINAYIAVDGLVREVYDLNNDASDEEIYNQYLTKLEEGLSESKSALTVIQELGLESLINEFKNPNFVQGVINKIKEAVKDPQFNEIKDWVIANKETDFEEASKAEPTFSESTFYYVAALYKADIEKIIKHIITEGKKEDLIHSFKLLSHATLIDQFYDDVENDLLKINAKNIAHNLVNLIFNDNPQSTILDADTLPVLKNSLYYYANGFLTDHQQAEERWIYGGIHTKETLEDITQKIKEKHPHFQSYSEKYLEKIFNFIKEKNRENDKNDENDENFDEVSSVFSEIGGLSDTNDLDNSEAYNFHPNSIKNTGLVIDDSIDELTLDETNNLLNKNTSPETNFNKNHLNPNDVIVENETNLDQENLYKVNADIDENFDAIADENEMNPDRENVDINGAEDDLVDKNIDNPAVVNTLSDIKGEDPYSQTERSDDMETESDKGQNLANNERPTNFKTNTKTDTNNSASSELFEKEEIDFSNDSEQDDEDTSSMYPDQTFKNQKSSKAKMNAKMNPSPKLKSDLKSSSDSQSPQANQLPQLPQLPQINTENLRSLNDTFTIAKTKDSIPTLPEINLENLKTLNEGLLVPKFEKSVKFIETPLPDLSKINKELNKLKLQEFSDLEKNNSLIDQELSNQKSKTYQVALEGLKKIQLNDLNDLKKMNIESNKLYEDAQIMSKEERKATERLVHQEKQNVIANLSNDIKLTHLNTGKLIMDLEDLHTQQVFEQLQIVEQADKVEKAIQRAEIQAQTQNLKGIEKRQKLDDLYLANALNETKEHLTERTKELERNQKIAKQTLKHHNQLKKRSHQRKKLTQGEIQGANNIQRYQMGTQASANKENATTIAKNQRRRKNELITRQQQRSKTDSIMHLAGQNSSQNTGLATARAHNRTGTTRTLMRNTNETKNDTNRDTEIKRITDNKASANNAKSRQANNTNKNTKKTTSTPARTKK